MSADPTEPPETRGPERYITTAELADLMGVSISTIRRLTNDGMPSVTWGKRTRRFKASIAIEWARARDVCDNGGDKQRPPPLCERDDGLTSEASPMRPHRIDLALPTEAR